MPLSDREQQILSDIEARLRQEDPKFAKTVSTTTVSTQTRHQLKLAAVGLVVGFVLMLLFIQNIWFGIAGFGLMLASAVYGGHNLKRLGQGQASGFRQLRGGFDRYLNDRRGRDDDEARGS